MYRALADPQDAIKLFEAAKDKIAFEGGDSKANAFHWIYTLDDLGQVDAGVTADVRCTPSSARARCGRIASTTWRTTPGRSSFPTGPG